jgi:hypothetical protein
MSATAHRERKRIDGHVVARSLTGLALMALSAVVCFTAAYLDRIGGSGPRLAPNLAWEEIEELAAGFAVVGYAAFVPDFLG